MPATTPPKGQPTPGRRDRNVAQRRAASRARIIRYGWAVLAITVLAVLLVLGTGTGGRMLETNLVLPALAMGRLGRGRLLSATRW